MGDRGNIVVRGPYGDVWFYTHWYGTDMKYILQRALARNQRWDDAAYLARIIFSELIKNDVDGETGYGISTHMLDNEHGILVVDVPNQKVVRVEEGLLVYNLDGCSVLPKVLDYRVSRTFEEYAKNGFKGPRKKVERRWAQENRRVVQPVIYTKGDRRTTYGRRKGDE